MIDPKQIETGDYVVVIAPFHDYGKEGDLYRMLDSRIPGEETSGVGWKIDKKTGLPEGTQPFKLPHEKIAPASRIVIANMLNAMKQRVDFRKASVDKERDVIVSRIEGLMNFDSKEKEHNNLLEKVFSFMR